MKTILTVLFAFALSNHSIGQANNSFNSGFNKGFKDTCDDAGFQGYSNYGDVRECQSNAVYVNDKNAEQKQYSEGYRCGVQQATKFIEKWKNQEKQKVNKTTNAQSPYQSPQPVDYPTVDQNINIDKNVGNYNYNNSRPAANYGKYIDPINTNLMLKAMSQMESSPRYSRPVNEYEKKRMFVNQMLYKYDEKLLKKSVKANKQIASDSKKIKSKTESLVNKNQLFSITTLSDGWYEVATEIEDLFTYRAVEVRNQTIVNYINGNKLRFPVTSLTNAKAGGTYNFKVLLPDGKTRSGAFYIISKKAIKTPEFYEPATYVFYTRGQVDDMLYARVFDDDFNELRGTELSWVSSSNPKCDDELRVVKFYLPINKTFDFHANTKTSFWKGTLTTDSPCKSLSLN